VHPRKPILSQFDCLRVLQLIWLRATAERASYDAAGTSEAAGHCQDEIYSQVIFQGMVINWIGRAATVFCANRGWS
jgi:hypothetical protein